MATSLQATAQPKHQSTGWYWVFSDSWLMAKRSILHIVRSFDQVMSLILFPVMFMLLNRYVFGGAINTGDVSYANFLFAGILVQTLAFGANYTTINLAVDMKEGIVRSVLLVFTNVNKMKMVSRRFIKIRKTIN